MITALTHELPWRIRHSNSVAVLLGVMAIMGSADAQTPTTTQPSGPMARPLGTFKDFGKVTEGEKVLHTFQMMNVGKAPLEIKSVNADCTCTKADKYPSVIEPGGTGDFSVSVMTAQLLGPIVKHLYVATNDPLMPTITFTLNAEVRRLIEVMPVTAGFGRIMDNEIREQIVTLTNRSNTPMTAKLREPAKTGNFDVTMTETVPGIEYKVFVVLRPPFKEGSLGANFVVETNIPSQNVVNVAASAVVLARREVMPNVLYLGDPSAVNYPKGKPVTKVLEFINHEPQAIHVMEGRCSDTSVKITVKEVEPGRLYRVLAEFPPDYRMTPEGQTITLVTNVADTPEFQVPVRMTGAVTKSATPTTSAPAPAKKPVMDLVGKAAPSLQLTTAAGLPVNNGEFKFFPATVLNFVSPECPFCKRQIPQVEQLRAQYEPKGVRFVFVSEPLHGKSYTQAEAQVAFDGLGSHSELAMDPEGKAEMGYRIGSFPILVVIGKDGVVTDAFPGARTTNIDGLKTRLEALLQKESGTK